MSTTPLFLLAAMVYQHLLLAGYTWGVQVLRYPNFFWEWKQIEK